MDQPQGPSSPSLLVSDFDGTITLHDFYELLLDRYKPPGARDYWQAYLDGTLSHFEALKQTYASAQPGEAGLIALAQAMEIEPGLAVEVEALRSAGWDVVITSNGCSWYIDRLLAESGTRIVVHANPGHIEDGRLILDRPLGSPYYSDEHGIEKSAVVRAAIAEGRRVAFAGNGPPDLAPSLLVPERLRFARGYLAKALTDRGEGFRPFHRWADVAKALCEGSEHT